MNAGRTRSRPCYVPCLCSIGSDSIPGIPMRTCDGFSSAGVSPAPRLFLELQNRRQDAGATLIQKINKHFVRNCQPVGREAKPSSVPFNQALSAQFFDARLQIRAVLGLDARKVDPGKLPQAEEQFFFKRLVAGDVRKLLDGKTALADCCNECSRIVRIGPALSSVERMGACADTAVRLPLPIL